MAQKTLEIKELLGSDRNRVQGQVDGVVAPSRLFNLVPDRRGGYTPFGRSVDKAITLANMANLVGFDESGLASFGTVASGTGKLELFDGDTSYAQGANAYPDIENAAHLASAGGYISRSKYLLLDRDENLAQPLIFSTEARAVTNGNVPSGEITAGTSRIYDIEFGNGVWMAVNAAGEIYESSNGTDWTLKFTATGYELRGITFGGGTWMAVGGNGTTARAYYAAAIDTATWTGVTVSGDTMLEKVGFVSGDIFVAAGRAIHRTIDAGVNWVKEFDAAWTFGRPIHFLGTTVTLVQSSPGNTGVVVSTDSGATWAARGANAWDAQYNLAVSPGGTWAYVTSSGEVWHTTIPDVNNSWIKAADNLLGNGRSIRAIRYNEESETWFVAGEDGKVLESSNLASWTPVEFQATTVSDLYAMAVDTTGGVVVGGDNGTILIAFPHTEVEIGTYEITTVSYFNTRAGRFVFDITTSEVAFPDRGVNTIDVYAPTGEKVIADTLASQGYSPPAGLIDNIKVDVYVKHSRTTVGNVDEEEENFEEAVNEPVTAYAFTASLASGAADADAKIGNIDDSPLGHELGNGAGVTTTVYEHPHTTLHAGRIWGMLSQNDTLYPNDGITLELANIFGGYILGYTEPAFANLLRPDNYLPLRPGQSTAFTGLLSTPSGLMVFFDNEVFVVDGDPAAGTLGYELYPDIIGNDEGVTPCRVGGVPFCIWDGQVYALVGGKAEPVSSPVYRQADPFVRIVAESSERSLLALTQAGEVWRYHLEGAFWLVDPSSNGIRELLPNNRANATDNTHYVTNTNAVVVTRRDGTPATPSITYRGINFGNPRQRYSIYRVRLPVEGLIVETDRTALGYNEALVPHLYAVRADTNLIDIDTPSGLTAIIAKQDEEMFTWTLPLGAAKSRFIDLRMEFQSLGYGHVVSPSIEVTYSEAGNKL